MAENWKQWLVTPELREIRFNLLMHLYNMRDPVVPLVARLIVNVLRNQRRWTQLQQETRLILVHRPRGVSVDAVVASLMNRYPVYFGNPRYDLFDRHKVAAYLGTTPTDQFHPELQYVIAGPAWTHHKRWSKIWVCHTWGVNLETTRTPAYAAFMRDGRLRRAKYRQYVERMVYGVFRGALSSGHPGSIVVNVPLVGLGAFLGAVTHETDAQFAHDTFFQALATAVQDHAFQRCYLRLALFTPQDSPALALLTQQDRVLVEQADLFVLPDPRAFRSRPKAPVLQCLVNAWDPYSFIGNGLVQDKTIDGKLVSGLSKLPNTSYLHNPFFAIGLLEPSGWLR